MEGSPMDDLKQLAELNKRRNSLEGEITALIGRPADIGYLGEYIASMIFHIRLEESASHKSIDGIFSDGPLIDRTVNIKWYARRGGGLDITPTALPEFYLVMTGPKSGMQTSRGQTRPWIIENVYLFDAHAIVVELERTGVKMGIETSVRNQLWAEAEIYPTQHNRMLELTNEQRKALGLFRSGESS